MCFQKWHEKFSKFSPKHLKVSIWDCFIQSRKCMSLNFTKKLSVITKKNNAKFGEKLTCHFKIDMINLMNFDLSTQNFQKRWLYWTVFNQSMSYLSWKSTEELCYRVLTIDTKFEEKQTCVFKNDMRNLPIFERLKNNDFILESKMAKRNQNKNWNQLNRPDSVLKIRFTFEINE